METDNNFATKQDSSNNRPVTDERYKELKERGAKASKALKIEYEENQALITDEAAND